MVSALPGYFLSSLRDCLIHLILLTLNQLLFKVFTLLYFLKVLYYGSPDLPQACHPPASASRVLKL